MKKQFLFIVTLILSVFGLQVSNAKLLDKPVAIYPLQCDETFSCPKSLHARVGFWVEVFSRWDTNTAIFHDKENPQRVFSTISRNNGCRGSSKGGAIERERTSIKASLKSLATKIEQGKSLDDVERQLQSVFGNASSSEIRAASDRIRCQSGNKDRMRTALSNFHQYRPNILDALESENISLELQYLPFVESAFDPKALSHVGAAGLWQIMPATGRSLGLWVDNVVDERYDPKIASYAAARYFRNSVEDLTETAFENGAKVTPKDLNPFVITSYNYGVRGMMRAINQVGLDYERLLTEYKSPNFQTAVKNFYASFLAARHVAKNSQQFFGEITPNASVKHSFNTVVLSRATSVKRLVNELSVDRQRLEDLNPSLNNVVWSDKALVPKNFKLKLPYQQNGWDSSIAKMMTLPAEYQKQGFVWHRVRPGESACGIAGKYRISCKEVFKINGLNSRGTIYAGRRIKIPSSTGGIGTRQSNGSLNSGVATQIYKVRAGDTACSIAARHTMKCGEFLALNGLTMASVIRVGESMSVSASDAWHVVRRGQSACAIAKFYSVSCNALLSANRLNRTSVIQVGQRLRIPARG